MQHMKNTSNHWLIYVIFLGTMKSEETNCKTPQCYIQFSTQYSALSRLCSKVGESDQSVMKPPWKRECGPFFFSIYLQMSVPLKNYKQLRAKNKGTSEKFYVLRTINVRWQ